VVGTKIEIHNNGLLGEDKIESFYPDIDRIKRNFHFSIVPVGIYFGVKVSSYGRGKRLLFWAGGIGQLAQCNVLGRVWHCRVCGCSVPVAE